MKTHIDKTSFGSITMNGKEYRYDVIIRLSGTIEKRQKHLSKQVTGTSHQMSVEEAGFIYEEGCNIFIVGTGQHGVLALLPEAQDYFDRQGCRVLLDKTPQAIAQYNDASGAKIGVFHITC